MNKELELLKLAKKRQSSVYDGYKGIGDYEQGYYECDYVSPYSKSAHNIDANVFVILQDWSSDENMHGKCELTMKYGFTPEVGTNKKLKSLLHEHLDYELEQTYATNLFPFIKMGGMSANIPIADMRRAASEYTVPMIEIIKPKIAIALGRKTYNALSDVCKNKLIIDEGIFDYCGTRVFHQPHPAARISNLDKAEKWRKMKTFLEA